MIKLTTRLPDELEREFRAHYLQRFLNHMRAMWVLGGILWGVGALADSALFPEVAADLRIVRIAVTLVVIAVVAALYIPAVVRGPVHIVAMVGTAAVGYGSVALVGITGFPDAMTHFVTTIVVAIVATCFVTILRVEYTIASCMSIVGAYALTVFVLTPTTTVIAARTTFAILGTTLVGLMATYIVEQYARENFAQRRALEASEKEAREAREEAIRANHAKSVFLSNMSHELRTPLNAVLGFAELMEREPARTDVDRTRLSIIQRSGEHLLSLINDVLSLSKIEAGKLVLNATAFDLREMLRSLDQMMRMRVEGKGLNLSVDADDSVPQAVRGDEVKLRQILINLLGNAVKFTETGTVRVRASWRGGVATFEVEDTGCGIAEGEISKLFEPFVQTDSGVRSGEGTGLGLAISREFANLMGGDVTVRSELGVGTTMTVTVPLPMGDANEVQRHRARVLGLSPGQGVVRVLVADDTRENRLLLVQLLDPMGFEVREAGDGLETVEEWKRFQPHVLFLDIRMPKMSGREVARAIRALEAESSGSHRTFVAALTASAYMSDRQDILDSGCDTFLTKPFRTDAIVDALAEHLGLRFDYEPEDGLSSEPLDVAALSRERFARLPRPVLEELAAALGRGDVERAKRAVPQIREIDPELADELFGALRSYRLDAVLDLLDGAPPP